MKTSIWVLVLLVGVCESCSAVTVTEAGFRFPLEAVRALGALMQPGGPGPAEQERRAAAACSSPALPPAFRPLCGGGDAAAALDRLALVASHPDACEICESVACTGC